MAAIEPLRAARRAAPREMPKSRSYSLFGLTPGTSVAVVSSMDLEESDQVASSPNLTRRIALVFLIVFNVTLVLSLLFNAPLEGPANPSVTPNPAKAPWYFVWLQELVSWTTVHLGKVTISGGFLGGILVPGILLAALVVWPFLDRSPAHTEGVWFARERSRQNVVFIIVLLAIMVLMFIGLFLRGPYWHIYWPWTARPAMPRVF
jgi:cytochrome b-561